MSEIVPVRLSTGELQTIREGDALWVVFRPAVEDLALSVETQVRKLNSRSWACTAERAVQLPGDSQVRTWKVVDRRTFTMWLATVNENNVPEEKRPLLVALQQEAADALDAYFHEGGAINPRASVEQLDELDRTIRHARGKAEVLAILRQASVVDGGYLDACGRRLAGQVMGETPQLDPQTRPLTVSMYLEGKDLTRSETAKVAGVFGKKLKAAYRSRYGALPPTIDDLVGRHVIAVAQYQERHRDLFDAVWSEIGGA